jgi:CelD/BcsL family acetyltransferase involved in cellulose biosynthesis
MTRPARFDPQTFAAAPVAAVLHDGLPEAIDAVAAASPDSHRFLRRQWYAAALEAYGGTARTIVASVDGVPALALPLVPAGPRAARLASVPGCYWPFRSFPASAMLSDAALGATLDVLGRTVRGLRIGPVYDGDPGAEALVAAARARGWGVVSRPVATSFLLDMAALRTEGQWPRGSTLRKNRFHEKHLASHGALDWRFVAPDGWALAFDMMAEVEKRSWLAERTDGRDAKFTRWGHGAFFRAAARDPAIAGMFHAALLTVDGAPAAFSFDLDAGDLKYAIANSYDPAYAKHSPGKLLYYRNLVEALDRGIARVDWGAGDSGYKRVIGAAEGPAIRDWLLLRPGLAARLAPVVRRMWR